LIQCVWIILSVDVFYIIVSYLNRIEFDITANYIHIDYSHQDIRQENISTAQCENSFADDILCMFVALILGIGSFLVIKFNRFPDV